MSDDDKIEFNEGKDNVKLSKKDSSYSVPVGPINVALHEPLRLYFEEEGEKVIDVDIKPGFTHVGIEKIATKRNPLEFIPVTQRICGICSDTHGFTFVRSVEDALDFEPPLRAQYIRVIIAELERIHSHLLWAGSAAHEIGFDSLFYYIWKEREKVMDALEYVSGNRVNYEMNLVGGVRRDLNEERIAYLKKALNYYENIKEEIEETLINDTTVKMRSRDVGVLSKEKALDFASVGPTTRASGVKKDIRFGQGYSVYSEFDFEPVIPQRIFNEVHGDVFDRIAVRVEEINQSIKIIKRCIEDLPEGDIAYEENLGKLLNEIKSSGGYGFARTEAPRGELIHYVGLKEGEENMSIMKVRAPTYGNLLSLRPMLIGEEMADIPIVGASIDPCMTCMDRMIFVENGEEETYSKKELREISKEKTERLKK